MDYGFSEKRRKRKDKKRERKKHPYKHGGRERVLSEEITKNSYKTEK